MEIANILDSLLERTLHFGRALGGRLLDFGFGHAEVLAFETIEFLGVFDSLRITAVLDISENVHDLVVNFLARGNFTAANSVNFLRLRSNFYDFHFHEPLIFPSDKYPTNSSVDCIPFARLRADLLRLLAMTFV